MIYDKFSSLIYITISIICLFSLCIGCLKNSYVSKPHIFSRFLQVKPGNVSWTPCMFFFLIQIRFCLYSKDKELFPQCVKCMCTCPTQARNIAFIQTQNNHLDWSEPDIYLLCVVCKATAGCHVQWQPQLHMQTHSIMRAEGHGEDSYVYLPNPSFYF